MIAHTCGARADPARDRVANGQVECTTPTGECRLDSEGILLGITGRSGLPDRLRCVRVVCLVHVADRPVQLGTPMRVPVRGVSRGRPWFPRGCFQSP